MTDNWLHNIIYLGGILLMIELIYEIGKVIFKGIKLPSAAIKEDETKILKLRSFEWSSNVILSSIWFAMFCCSLIECLWYWFAQKAMEDLGNNSTLIIIAKILSIVVIITACWGVCSILISYIRRCWLFDVYHGDISQDMTNAFKIVRKWVLYECIWSGIIGCFEMLVVNYEPILNIVILNVALNVLFVLVKVFRKWIASHNHYWFNVLFSGNVNCKENYVPIDNGLSIILKNGEHVALNLSKSSILVEGNTLIVVEGRSISYYTPDMHEGILLTYRNGVQQRYIYGVKFNR